MTIIHFVSGQRYTGPGNAHYIKVLRSSRKPPTNDAQHLDFPPSSQANFFLSSVLSSSVTSSGNLSLLPSPSSFSEGTDQHHAPLFLMSVLVILSLLPPPRSIPGRLIPWDQVTRMSCPPGFSWVLLMNGNGGSRQGKRGKRGCLLPFLCAVLCVSRGGCGSRGPKLLLPVRLIWLPGTSVLPPRMVTPPPHHHHHCAFHWFW